MSSFVGPVNYLAHFPSNVVKWVDPKTGLLTRESALFVRDLFSRIGGSSAVSLTAITEIVEHLMADTTLSQLDARVAELERGYQDVSPVYVEYQPAEGLGQGVLL